MHNYCISLISVPFFLINLVCTYIAKGQYSNYCTFEIASLVNVPGHYLRKYSIWVLRVAFFQKIFGLSEAIGFFEFPLLCNGQSDCSAHTF